MVPLYVQYMGAETYGLVGFFAMLQAWFQLLDMGLTPTMARETARYNGGAIDALSLRRLLRALEGVFVGVAMVGGGALIAGAGVIAQNWLKVEQLPLVMVQQAIMLMAVIVALRWICGLYRGAINGFERQVWLSGFNIAVATARFVLVIPLFIFVGTSATHFFAYQLLVAFVELFVLIMKTYSLLPKAAAGKHTPWQSEPLRKVLKFSIGIAFTSSVWVLITQTDKLVLSKLLPLADYAYFTLAVLVAGGVTVISGPISGALLPRMTKLAAQSDDAGLIRLYRNATQLVTIIAIPAALVLGLFSKQVLWAWTGDLGIAEKAADVLALYSLGNGVLALAAFPYYLQFAKGDLRLHLIGNAFFVALLIPTLIWATIQFGMVGAGFAWLGSNLVYFIIWVAKVHHRFVDGLHGKWLWNDVGAILVPTAGAGAIVHSFATWPDERAAVAVQVAIFGLLLLTIASLASSFARESYRKRLSPYLVKLGK